MDFPEATGEKVLSYDAEWLAVLKTTHHMLSLQRHTAERPGACGQHVKQMPCSVVPAGVCRIFPTADMQRTGPSAEAMAFVDAVLANGVQIPSSFAKTVPEAGPAPPRRGRMPRSNPRNPQTEALLKLIGCEWNLGEDHGLEGIGWGAQPVGPVVNPEELALEDDEEDLEG